MATVCGRKRAAVACRRQLHDDIVGKEKAATKKAIQAGKLLLQLKEGMPHGEWLPALEAAGIPRRTASQYMMLNKWASVAHLEGLPLTQAYAKAREEQDRQAGRDIERRHRKLYALADKAAWAPIRHVSNVAGQRFQRGTFRKGLSGAWFGETSRCPESGHLAARSNIICEPGTSDR